MWTVLNEIDMIHQCDYQDDRWTNRRSHRFATGLLAYTGWAEKISHLQSYR